MGCRGGSCGGGGRVAVRDEVRFPSHVGRPDNYDWTARDKKLGSPGRRMGDPEYNDFIVIRGVLTPRSLADDGAKLLNLKERSVFEYALLCARADRDGYGGLRPEHIPAEIAGMRGPTPTWTMVNAGIDNIVHEPRWVMRHANGEVLGGKLTAAQVRIVRQELHVQHGTVVHHHHGAPQHVHHGTPADQRAIAEAAHILRKFSPTW